MTGFDIVHSHLHGEDRHGRFHADCPNCNKEVKRGQTHFSYTRTNWFCGVCSWGGSIDSLARYLSDGSTPHVVTAPKEKSKDDVIRESIYPMNAAYRSLSERDVIEWQKYKPISADLIDKFGLRCSYLPTPSGPHKTERLIVPLTYKGRIWGMKGRLTTGFIPGPDYTPPKWLFSPTSLLRTWGLDGVVKGIERLWITENYIDAILLHQCGEVAISTGGIGGITDRILSIISEADPGIVIVAYDNDNAGCGNDETVQLMNEQRAIKGLRPQYPQGPDVARLLQKNRIRATCRTWPNGTPPKTDIGDILTKRIETKEVVK